MKWSTRGRAAVGGVVALVAMILCLPKGEVGAGWRLRGSSCDQARSCGVVAGRIEVPEGARTAVRVHLSNLEVAPGEGDADLQVNEGSGVVELPEGGIRWLPVRRIGAGAGWAWFEGFGGEILWSCCAGDRSGGGSSGEAR